MKRKRSGRPTGVAGVVTWFDAGNGWSVIDAPELPGGCSSTLPVSKSRVTAILLQVGAYGSPLSSQVSRRMGTHIAPFRSGHQHRAPTVPCDNFLYGFKGAPAARQAPTGA